MTEIHNRTVTCLIPAFNEGVRIGAVLRAVVGHPQVCEVLVVDDGSLDDTAAVVRSVPGATLIEMPHNSGKTAALVAGIRAAQCSYLLLVDADLSGLTPEHISALLAPVRTGRADVSVSLRENAPRFWHWLGIDYISGERVLPKSLLDHHAQTMLALPRFGFEVFLNSLLISQRSRVAVVRWPGVRSPPKRAKMGWRKGLVADAKMIGDMARSVGWTTLVRQIVMLWRMRMRMS
jgi:glycosyltransferase involved in cell wall biosynthesis